MLAACNGLQEAIPMSRTNGSYQPPTPELLAAPERPQDDHRERNQWSGGTTARERQIAMISHELRNSLTVVRTAAKLLQRSPGMDGIESTCMLIERHAGHMGRHIEELLAHDRDGGVCQSLQFARADLRKFAGYAIDAISADCSRRGHLLSAELPAQPVWVYGDGARLEQLFANLLMNAAKYTPDGGRIAMTMEHADGWARVRIRDSGVGIAASVLPRIFGLFSQADKSLPSIEGGQGIGLAVVRNLVTQHGGSVNAISAGLGLGSEFTVSLPTL
jgi:signal transduction histidine kinase